MPSPDEQRLIQKERALKLKEDALSRQAQQQQKTEERLKSHQDSVAKKERANQLKAQDLIKRERKYQEDSLILDRERQSFEETQSNIERSRNRSMTFVLPLLLIAGIIAGYFTFEQMSSKQKQFDQIALASKNIDKLASILSLTQDEVIHKSSALSHKKDELEKTKFLLSELKNTTTLLKTEISQLRQNQRTSNEEKASLAASAETLQKQLKELKQQLEDEYLNIDIIEALVAYQEKTYTAQLKGQQDVLTRAELSLNEHKSLQAKMHEMIEQQNLTIAEQKQKLDLAESESQTLQTELTERSGQAEKAKEQIESLKQQIEKLKKASQQSLSSTEPANGV